MKLISFIRQTAPSDNSKVFNDPITVFNDGTEIYKTSFGRTTPNPLQPKTSKIWDTVYGTIALGMYDAVCIEDKTHGKCLLIAGGKEIPAAMPNPNHEMRHVVNGALVHCSDSDTWSGSAACLTIKKSGWDKFILLFTIGEHVKIEIKGI